MSTKAEIIMKKIASTAPVADQLIEHYRSGGPKPKFKEYLAEGREIATKNVKRSHRGATIGLGVLGGIAGASVGVGSSVRGAAMGAVGGAAVGAGLGYLAGRRDKNRRLEHVNSPSFEVRELAGFKGRDAQLKYLYKHKV